MRLTGLQAAKSPTDDTIFLRLLFCDHKDAESVGAVFREFSAPATVVEKLRELADKIEKEIA
jgi:hypothetical protein